MLTLQELKKILKDNNINDESFNCDTIRSFYNAEISDEKILPLLQEMVLTVIDFDTPLYDILAYINDFEQKIGINDDFTAICDIFDIVLSNLAICAENAERLIDLTEDADLLDVYNTLMDNYKEFLTEKQIVELKEKMKETFDKDLLIL